MTTNTLMPHPIPSRRAGTLALAALAAATLTACGGGGGGNETGPSPIGNAAGTVAVQGVLVQPENNTASSTTVVAHHTGTARQQALAANCSEVPTGYQPLGQVAVQFSDASGQVLSTLTTDACGGFDGQVPVAATQVLAAPAGTQPIRQPIVAYTGGTATVTSALPTSASLVVSVLQHLGQGKVALTVTDSTTGKPVLGLDDSQFSFRANGAPLATSDVSYGASTADQASVSVVLDASGSMFYSTSRATREPIQLASYATHALLDGLSSGDEAGLVIFDSQVTTINNTALATTSRFRWVDANGVAAGAPNVGGSGLTTDFRTLRPLVDAYNPYSSIYRNSYYTTIYGATADAVHADTGALRLASAYPWSGSTAFYSATSAGISQLAAARNPRKIVVAMTDGLNNAGNKTTTKAQVISEAKAAGIPLYTVAFGTASSVDEKSMTEMAQQTGGEYKRVEGDDLTGLFQSIQIGIRFQYVGTLASPLPTGSTLQATVTAGSETVSRDLVIQ